MSIVVRQLRHRYRKSPEETLRGIDLDIPDGVSVAIVGPSGSGKTTLLTILGGICRPTSGIVEIDGVNVWRRRRFDHRTRGRCTWIFQHTNVLPRLSAEYNAMLGPLGRGASWPVAARRVRDALVLMGIDDLAASEARLLSGGQAQRVGIARALASDAALLFADEPTGQLDSATTDIVIRQLVRSRTEGETRLIATHDERVAAQCDLRVRVLDGKVVETT